ncbi:hypothetical protein KP509_08G055600 [Ceratopteris richardii]|nr:hypothetical protein KP509_08G055600 [Ceratopteris richardii]
MFMEIITSRMSRVFLNPSTQEEKFNETVSSRYGHDFLGLVLAEIDICKQKAMVNLGHPHGCKNIIRRHHMFQNKTGEEELEERIYSSQHLMDECKTFFFTGHETTWLLLTWTFMLLASYPSWQERAREEAIIAMKNTFGLPQFDMLSKLQVLDMILLETLRLYTPATILAREAFTDIKVGNLEIPKGLSVWVPVLAIHHDKDIWGEDANEFKPERFANGVSKSCKHPMAFMPFSFGPRNCVGQNFAMMEAKIVLSLLLSRFSFELSPSYIHAPICILTLQPKYGVPIIVRRIKSDTLSII